MMSPKENGNGVEPMSNGSNKSVVSSSSAASDLIRQLDSAFSEMSSAAAMAARDAEDARRNAHAVSEFARRFSSKVSVSNRDSRAGMLPSSHVSTALEETDEQPQPTSPHATTAQTEVNGEELAHAVQEINAVNLMKTTNESDAAVELSPQGSEAEGSAVSGKKRKDRQLQADATTEQLARSRADEVLTLSRELDRATQALEREQNSHYLMKAALQEEKAKNAQLEAQVQKLLSDMETQREDERRKADVLQQQLSQAQIRVEAAEEDAELALDLAKGNAEDREQYETWLQRSLQEVQVLRNQLKNAGFSPKSIAPSPSDPLSDGVDSETKKRVVRFADTPTEASPEPTLKVTPKSLVVAGKSLLIRSGGKAPTPTDTEDFKTMYTITLTPDKSAERRRMLRKRVEELHQNGTRLSTSTALVRSPGTPIQDGLDMRYTSKAMEYCQRIVVLLRDSGKRLGLGGHWWTRDSPDDVDVNVEAMARQYCHSVEVKLDRQKGEMNELHALCEFLEQNLKSSSTPSGPIKES